MSENKFDLREPEEADRGPFQASTADYEATRRRKALCLRNALTIVERFGMNPISKEMIALALPWLEREQYDDIPVERVGYGNCGYLLCLNPASATQFKQRYRISVARRRVYEIGDRKYFCSDWCYRASCYLRRQIPSEPAWCRPLPTGPMLGLKFLPPNAPGRPGKTILDALGQLRLNADIENTGTRDEFSSSSEGEYEDYNKGLSDKDSDAESSSSNSDGNGEIARSVGLKQTLIPWNETIPHISSKITERNIAALSNMPKSMNKVVTASCAVKENFESNPAGVVLSRLREWFTKKAAEVLFSRDSCISVTNISPSNPSTYEKRAIAFLSGNPSELPQENLSPEEQPLIVTMPLVDSVSQNSYRLRLLMESLLPSWKNVLFRLEIPMAAVFEKLQNIVAQFNLTNKNIHLRPQETSLMCLCLLHLLLGNNSEICPHYKLVEMVAAFKEIGDGAEGLLCEVMEIAEKLHEENLDSPS